MKAGDSIAPRTAKAVESQIQRMLVESAREMGLPADTVRRIEAASLDALLKRLQKLLGVAAGVPRSAPQADANETGALDADSEPVVRNNLLSVAGMVASEGRTICILNC